MSYDSTGLFKLSADVGKHTAPRRVALTSAMVVPQKLSSLSDSELVSLVEGIKTHRRGDGALRPNPAFSNWARTFACHPEVIYYPSSEDDVRCIVELARRKGKKLRPFGAGHSPSDLVCVQEDGWLMQMDALNELLEVGSCHSAALCHPAGKLAIRS